MTSSVNTRHSEREPDSDRDLVALVTAMHEGQLTVADRDRLERLLAEPAARSKYRRMAKLHTSLLYLWHHAAESVSTGLTPPSDPPGRREPPTADPDSRTVGRGVTSGGPAAPAATSDRGRNAAAVDAATRWISWWLRACSKPAVVSCLVAAVVITSGLAIAAILQIRIRGDIAAGRQPTSSVAFISGVHGPVRSATTPWGVDETAPRLAELLHPGSRITIDGGLVEISYIGGATAVVEGPAAFEIVGPSEGRLSHGRVVIRTRHRGDRISDVPLFSVITPRGVVEDLGTEFGVDVPTRGNEAVHVFEGVVDVVAGNVTAGNRARAGASVRLTAGRSAMVGNDLMPRASAASSARRFVRFLPAHETERVAKARGSKDAPPVGIRPAVWNGENVEEFEPVRARFVRFSVFEVNDSYGPCLDELEVFATDGRNVARRGTATASGVIPGHAIHAIAHVNDGIYGNDHSWICDTTRGWIQVELREEAEIDRIVWSRDRTAPPRFVDRIPTQYAVSVSLDGTTWKTVATSSGRLPFGSPRLPPATPNGASQ